MKRLAPKNGSEVITRLRAAPRSPTQAFSLLEVMIAIGIFFIAVFSILELTSRSLKQARALQQMNVDVGSLAAELSLTNKLEEGSVTGDFGDTYPNYTWSRETYQITTNGLFQIDFTVYWALDRRPLESKMSIWLYRPESPMRFSGGSR